MKPHIHAENSVRKYKGVVADYIKMHIFDEVKPTFEELPPIVEKKENIPTDKVPLSSSFFDSYRVKDGRRRTLD